MSMFNESETANVNAARKELAVAKRRYPAGTAKTPAETASGTSTAKKAAAKAPEKADDKSPRKTPQQSSKAKLRWVKVDGDLVATTDEAVYAIVKSGDAFKATVKRGNAKPQVIVEGASGGRCYSALTRLYHYGEMPEGKKAAAKKASA